MKPLDTLPLLKELLNAAGFNSAQPSPHLAWLVFQKYLDLPVTCDSDTALFQVGDFSSDRKAYLDFCREFRLRTDDGTVWYEQVHLEFTRAALPDWGRRGVQRWASNFPNREAFVREVESLPEFSAGLSLSGWTSSVYHTGV